MERWADSVARRVEFAGIEVKRLAELAGVSRPTIHAILRGKEPSAGTRGAVESAFASIAAELSPQGAEEHPGLTEVASDHRLLTALGVGEAELSRVRALLGTRDAALLVLAALRCRGA